MLSVAARLNVTQQNLASVLRWLLGAHRLAAAQGPESPALPTPSAELSVGQTKQLCLEGDDF